MMEDKQRERNRLLTPSLTDVRTHQIGKFPNYKLTIPGSKKSKTIYHFKSFIHPKWFEHFHTTEQMDIYLSKRALDFLKRDGKVSGRWSRNRKWVPKKKGSSKKGEWHYRYRTPKGTVWMPGSRRKSTQKGNSGRKPGGTAYKVRREAWRVLSLEKGQISKLLENSIFHPQEREPIQKFPLRIPNLSNAIEEIIIMEVWPKLTYHRESIVNGWLNLRGVRSSLHNHGVDNELCNQLVRGTLEVQERNKIIRLICQKHWRKILANWIELKVFSEHMDREDHFLIAFSALNNAQSEVVTQEVNKPNVSFDIKCDCVYSDKNDKPEPSYNKVRGEIWCEECGLIVGRIFSSVNEVTFEETELFEYY
jgi:hypothetical protein